MNIIDAIYNLVNHPVVSLTEYSHGRNRINNVGNALEEYIKDLFTDSFDMNKEERMERLSKEFSYLGNTNNPPDMMLRSGDAIEVKKIESSTSALALNSSYPKHTLTYDNPLLSNACKRAENWSEKDILYAIGVVKKGTDHLSHLTFVYGLDYCASEECYKNLWEKIKNGVETIPGISFSETKELGHINRVDPLGITYMRVRGMWGIENPLRVFDYIYQRDMSKRFSFMCIINDVKWSSFKNTDRITGIQHEGFQIKNVKIKDPDNPAKLVSAKLITFSI